MTDLKALIERLEKASGPDRELDALILKAINPNVVQTYVGLPDYATEIVYVEGKQAPLVSSIDVPQYTRSIDAAMTLVPPQFEFEIGSTKLLNCYYAMLVGRHGEHIGKRCANPAIALCIAALKAMGAK